MSPATIAVAVLLILGVGQELIRRWAFLRSGIDDPRYALGATPFTLYREARLYRELCLREGRPLTWWRAFWVFHVTWVLLLALTVTGWVMYESLFGGA